MEEKRKSEKAPLIYAIVGVAVLIVAVAGSTFAFFSASGTATNKIVGTAASVGLEITLTDETANATGNLIPIDESNLSNGATGYQNKGKCIDKNDNTVCKIYKVTVKNTSTAVAILSGSVNIAADTEGDPKSKFTNLKWNKMTNLTTPGSSYPVSTTSLTTDESFTAGQSKDYYVMVYINNVNSNQSSDDTGKFIGTVSFNSASGSEVKAAF